MLFETVTVTKETAVSLPIIYTGFKHVFSSKIFYTLAQLSYGIFLMHTSYVVTILYFKGTTVNGDNFSAGLWLWKGLCLSAMMVLLSLAANVFVEKPLRKVRKFIITTLFPAEEANKMIWSAFGAAWCYDSQRIEGCFVPLPSEHWLIQL